MPIDLPVVLLIAAVALVVASTVAQRAAPMPIERPAAFASRTLIGAGPIGAVVDVLDKSVAAYTVRARLGLSTLTREERRAADQRAAAIAHADETSSASPASAAPKRLVVAGSAGHGAPVGTPARSTLSVELLAAALGLAVVVLGSSSGSGPRERGGVLSATGAPAPCRPLRAPSRHRSPTASPEPAAT